jgi:hypothetical protein
MEFTIEGIEETARMLEQAPRQVVVSGYTKALEASAEVVMAELWPRVPINAKAAMGAAHGGHGALVTGLDYDIFIDPQARGGVAEVGFGNLGHIALWVEYGHRRVGHGKSKKARKELGEVPAYPFMRPAIEASAEAAIDAFAGSLAETVATQYKAT